MATLVTSNSSSVLSTVLVPLWRSRWIRFPIIIYLVLAVIDALLARAFKRSSAPYFTGKWLVVGHLYNLLQQRDKSYEYCLQSMRSTRRMTQQLFIPFLPPYIVTVDPQNVEHYLSKNFYNYEKGYMFHDNLSDLLGEGIFTSDGARWKIQRKTASQIFTTKNFREFFTAVFLEESAVLSKRLESAAQSGEIIDLCDYLHRLTLDSFGKLAFGINLKCLESDKPQPFAAAFDGLQKICEERFITPGWQVIEVMNGTSRRAAEYKRIINEFAFNIIRQRRVNPESVDITKADLITRFMTTKDENGNLPNDTELRDIVTNFIIAGRDTTALVMSWTFFELHRNPKVLAHLVAEIDEPVSKLGPGEEINYDIVKGLTYAHCCISETLRLHPSVPKNAKMAVDDDVLPDGTFVPKGSILSHAPWVMGRMTEIWGPDAEEYRPERWLNTIQGSEEIDATSGGAYQAKVNQFKFPAFHAGPRLCLGQGMAYLEAVSVLAFVLRRLKVEVQEPEKVGYLPGIVLPMKGGLKVRVSMRPNSKKS